MQKPTDVPQFMQELTGGNTAKVLAKALSDASISTLLYGGKKTANILLDLKIEKLNDDTEDALKITATVKASMPTQRGKKSEEEGRECVMYYSPSKGLSDTPAKADSDDVLHPSMANAGFSASKS